MTKKIYKVATKSGEKVGYVDGVRGGWIHLHTGWDWGVNVRKSQLTESAHLVAVKELAEQQDIYDAWDGCRKDGKPVANGKANNWQAFVSRGGNALYWEFLNK